MKKMFTVLFIVLLCFSIVSCNEAINNNSSENGSSEINETNESVESETDQTENGSSEINETNESVESETDQTENGEQWETSGGTPPIQIIHFKTIDDMRHFYHAAKGTSDQYEEYMREMHPNIFGVIFPSHYDAQIIASDMEGKQIPLAVFGVAVDEFEIYYDDRGFDAFPDQSFPLYVDCRIDGILYRFSFPESYSPQSSPAIETQNIDGYVVELRKDLNTIYGEVECDSGILRVVIFTDEIEDVKLDSFVMQPIIDQANE